jgi:hypothetical protein
MQCGILNSKRVFKIALKKSVSEGMDWIDLAQDREK